MKVKVIQTIAHPHEAVILRPGAVADLPDAWARFHQGKGVVELIADPKVIEDEKPQQVEEVKEQPKPNDKRRRS